MSREQFINGYRKRHLRGTNSNTWGGHSKTRVRQVRAKTLSHFDPVQEDAIGNAHNLTRILNEGRRVKPKVTLPYISIQHRDIE